MAETITTSSKLLVAALFLEEKGTTPFCLEDLVLAAWRQYPFAFGLKGYEKDHPDTHRSYSYLMGQKGLVAKGMLNKKEQDYTLTPTGRAKAYTVAERSGLSIARRGTAYELEEELDTWLSNALVSDSVFKARQGLERDIESNDVFNFFRINASSTPTKIDLARDKAAENIHILNKLVIQSDSLLLRNGRFTTEKDILLVCRVHRLLESRFKSLLELLRRRNGDHHKTNGTYIAKGHL